MYPILLLLSFYIKLIRCQANSLTCEISDFMPCTHAQSNILHIKHAEKTNDWCLVFR